MSADVIRLELPASYKYLNILSACLAELLQRVEGLVEITETTANVQIAVHEVCTNIVRHAYQELASGRIEITLTLTSSPDRLLVHLHDTGRSFDPSTISAPNLDQVQEHGYGLFLTNQLMDEVKYESGADGNDWYLVKNLQLLTSLKGA